MIKTLSKRKTKKIIQSSLLMLGFLLFFVSGAFNKDATFERTSEYITNVVTKKTKEQKYCAVAFETKDKSGDYYGNEFSNLFDVFRSGVATYTSAMNVNKEEDITFSEYATESLSFVFLGPVGSMDIKDENDKVIGYRHYLYNFDTMFKDSQYNGSEFDKKHSAIIYLSQTQADNILQVRGVNKGADNKYSVSDYETLIHQPVNLKFNNNPSVEYIVWNIYFDDTSNFYYYGVRSVLGEFVLTSYYQPTGHNLRDSHKSIYFFNEYSYYNQYLMRYLNERFSEEKPNATIVKNNLISEIDDDYFLSFYFDETISNLEWVYYILLILSFSLIVGSIVLFFTNETFSFKFIMLNVLVSFAPYLIFKFIYLITNDVLFFSRPSVKVAAIAQSIFILIILSVPIYRTISLNSAKADYYELNV